MWNMRITALSLLVVTCAASCGNSEGGAPAGTAAPGTAAPGAGTGTAAPAAAGGGKLVHHTGSKGPCSFEFDVPEKLPETAKDEMSFTMETETFTFSGSTGSSLYGIDQLKGLKMMGGKSQLISAETANGVHLVITRYPTPSDPRAAVSGHGEEADAKDRQLGCSFLCRGVKEREADLVAMCKSVRIKYDASKAQ